jgi:hypothetical protein
VAVSAFKDLSWNDDDTADKDKLNLMVANTRYLFERAPKLYFNGYGVKKDTGIKIASGTAVIPPKKATSQLINIYFGSFFTPGCKPVITNGIVSHYNGRIIPTMYALQGVGFVPDHTGFVSRLGMVETNSTVNYFVKTMYLHWIAVGY